MKLKEPQIVVNYFGVHLFLPRDFTGGFLAMDSDGSVYYYDEEPEFKELAGIGLWAEIGGDEFSCLLVCVLEGTDLKPKDSLFYIE